MEGTRSRERGFTLIEVMVAMLLTVVAVIGIVALYMVETRASGFSRHESEASVLAEDKLETLWTGSGAPTVGSASEVGIDSTGSGSAGIYTRWWDIEAGSGSNSTVYYDYTVTVSWNEGDGGSASGQRSVTEQSRK